MSSSTSGLHNLNGVELLQFSDTAPAGGICANHFVAWSCPGQS